MTVFHLITTSIYLNTRDDDHHHEEIEPTCADASREPSFFGVIDEESDSDSASDSASDSDSSTRAQHAFIERSERSASTTIRFKQFVTTNINNEQNKKLAQKGMKLFKFSLKFLTKQVLDMLKVSGIWVCYAFYIGERAKRASLLEDNFLRFLRCENYLGCGGGEIPPPPPLSAVLGFPLRSACTS